ncbi:phage tail tape measure protein [Bacteroides intestinalis]|jgi:TP901 family phage tail tape measure protein|uniref:phage tail tape measure protein n=1 Tax=Bacteroides intestinalis TaxID=329854 RepID=UPI000E1C600C|nr:phage tail tape measure protein [Bacteroides intestinalis]DAV24057.1 MAG TPA: minor tail protein [Caudoviricetes sp.]QDO71590.1 phage tail tape measure protein [Bacteroides intestinalis]RGX85787.1 phage tail tape measure protein [Bacteroides intestinalis]UCB37681.1 phage tail tape measure protein [Bacteroides intestinalis]UCB41924.1 phage tail tape measure protein [Bacteroides intestinalis]
MGEFGISGLIKEGELEKLEQCDAKLIKIKNTYVDVAKELAKGMKMEIETPKELDKLFALYSAQVATAEKTNTEFNVTLDKQKKVLQEVADNLQKQASASDLSAKDMKQLADVNAKNAAALEKVAKAELAATKAQNSGNSTRRNANISEEERLRIIKDAITLTNREVHSIIEAETANKQLRQAVKLLRDTDTDYITILARLNSTIDTNSNYSKKNSDAQTRQKLTVGAYREEVKLAILEIEKGNNRLQNFGTIASNAGKALSSQLSPGLNKVHDGMKNIVAGYVGGQAVINGIVTLFTKLREGVGSIVEFEFANSRLAAILGTTSDNIKELTADAKRLGAMTKYTASEATELQIELAKLGFTRKEVLQATESVLRFAQATGAELGEAAALSGAALRMFDADTKETERYVSAMAVATTKSALSFNYLATALPIVGPVAKSFNFTIEDTLALLGKLADAGFDASMSATATRNILLNLADGSGKLALALGKPVKTLPDLVDGLKTLRDRGVDLNTTLELTDKRSVSAFNAFLTSADKLVPLREQITGVDEELAGMAHTMEDNVKGSIASLSSAWEALMLTFSNSKGTMKSVLDFLARGVRNIADDFKSLEDKETEAMQEALRGQREIASEFKIEERYINEIKEAWQGYMDGGMDSQEAFKKAVEEKKEYLNSEIKKYSEVADKAEFSYRKVTEAMQKSNMFTRAQSGTSMSTYNKQRNFQFGLWTEAEKNAEKYRYVLENVDAYESDYVNEHTEKVETTKVLTEKEKRELEKAAAEKRKIQESYQDSILALMNEGLDKELKKIGLEYSKKIAAVKGYSKEEIATRENLAKEMQDAIQRFSIQYNANREKQDIANSLEVVQKGSKEELALKLRQLDLQREAEIDAAEKTGEDVFAIDQKFASKKQQILEENTAYQVQLIAENAAAEQIVRDQQYQTDMLALKKQLAERQITQKEFAEREYLLTLDYVQKTNEAAIDALELELQADNLSAEDRKKIAEELQRLKAEFAQKEAEAEISAIEKVAKADDKAHKDRMRSLQNWLQTAQQAIGNIGDLIATVYDGQITKIEDEQDANDEAYDRDIERIEKQVEYGVLSEEEAEIRKRAAKEKTEAKNRELEKKKQDLARKQAIWDKATSIAQAGIATALAITKALPNFILAAIVGAMGAIQVATIAATPIPSYAEGTKDGSHPGGKALVGDGGKHEVVMYKGMAWITPDAPMIVDLPTGAQVFPDVDDFGSIDWDIQNSNHRFLDMHGAPGNRTTVVNNDFSRLESRIDKTNQLLEREFKKRRRDDNDRDFDNYIRSRI